MSLTEEIGRLHVVGGQLANSPEVSVLGPFDQPGECISWIMRLLSFDIVTPFVRRKEFQPLWPEIQGYQIRMLRTSSSSKSLQFAQTAPPSRGEAASSNRNPPSSDPACFQFVLRRVARIIGIIGIRACPWGFSVVLHRS